MTKTALAVADPPPVPPGDHAPDCDGRCSPWLAVGKPTCLPYPCQCFAYRASRPEWGRERCWWVKRNTERTVSGCPCWGQPRDGKPGTCCVHHSANPRYAPPPPPPTLDDLDVAPLLDDWDRPAPRVDAGLLDWNGFDPEVEYASYERLWAPEELTCDCLTPFDQDRRPTGWHCAGEGCHQNFKSYAVGAVHRRRWTEPCRPPWTIVDVDTGQALMYQDGKGVWGLLYPTAE